MKDYREFGSRYNAYVIQDKAGGSSSDVSLSRMVRVLEGRTGTPIVWTILSILALILYGRTLNGGFVVDDWWWAAKQIGHDWTANDHRPLFYRPVVGVVYWALWSAVGPTPVVFHALNSLCLIVTGGGVFHLAKLLTGERLLISFFAALLFILNPSHAEPVSWAAGMTDVLSTMFAVWGIVGALQFFANGRWMNLACGVLMLALGMLSKESVVFAPLIACALALILRGRSLAIRSRTEPDLTCDDRSNQALSSDLLGRSSSENDFTEGRTKAENASQLASPREVQGREFWMGAGVLFLLIPVYILIRASALPGGVGGYSSIQWAVLPATILQARGLVHASNSFLPLFKLIDPYTPLVTLFALHWMCVAIIPAIFLGGLPGGRHRRLIGTSAAALMLALLMGSLLTPAYPMILALFRLAPMLWPATALLLAFGIYQFSRMDGSRRIRDALAAVRTRSALLFACLSLACCFALWSPTGITPIIPIVLMWIVGWAIPWQRTPTHLQLSLVVTITLTCWLLAIAPSLQLDLGLDGQQSRFSYFATSISAVTLAAALSLIPRWRIWIAGSALLLYGGLSWEATSAWAVAGSISRQTTAAIGEMKGADRIVVIGAPATLNSALLFLGGMEEIPRVMFGSTAKLEVVQRMHFALSGDRWRIRTITDGAYLMEIQRAEGSHVRVLPPDKPVDVVLGSNRSAAIVQVRHLTKNTRVIAIDGGGITVLR